MELLFRAIRPDEVEQEVTQRDQFNTDAVGLAETLVREALQNSVDGRSQAAGGPVRARIGIFEPSDKASALWDQILSPLRPHLEACDMKEAHGLDFSHPRLLVIEDFGTTGLLGATHSRDKRNFSDFWRRQGLSHKHGRAAGRWGLGKLVFSSASAIRTFFGLTVQEEDQSRCPLLMGQAVLKNHRLVSDSAPELVPHGFFALSGPDGLQVPASDPALVSEFAAAAGITRVNEPGLSIVVPFPNAGITVEAMLPHVIRNWFFPILTKKLIVEIGPFTLNDDTFSEIAREHGGVEFADGRRVGFVSQLHAARNTPPTITLPTQWITAGMEQALGEDQLSAIRADYAAGKLVGIRAPMTIRTQTGKDDATYVDLYLQECPEMERGEAFFVRGAITIPGEARRFRGRRCFGALVAEDAHVVSFLGDAENPAHTSWSGTAEKLRERWKNPGERLREIRDALNRMFEVITLVGDHVDNEALKQVFFVETAGGKQVRRPRNPVITPPTVPDIPRRPAAYNVVQRKSGFVIRGTKDTELPLSIRVRAAYDVVEGNPLKQYSEYDFDIAKGDIRVDSEGADAQLTKPNELIIEVSQPDFAVKLEGFDENRDLFVQAERLT